jgi:hypothetical protein
MGKFARSFRLISRHALALLCFTLAALAGLCLAPPARAQSSLAAQVESNGEIEPHILTRGEDGESAAAQFATRYSTATLMRNGSISIRIGSFPRFSPSTSARTKWSASMVRREAFLRVVFELLK